MFKFIYILIISIVFISCTSGANGGTQELEDNNKIEINTQFSLLLKLDTVPVLNTNSSLSLISNDLNQNDTISWSVDIKPSGSVLDLSSENTTSINISCDKVGQYKITASVVHDFNTYTKSINFNVKEVFAFDNTKMNNLGVISNQSWVYSNSLDENNISAIVSKYNLLTKIGYDSIQGVLVEYDETDTNITTQIENLKLENGITKVYNRTVDNSAVTPGSIIPNDEIDINTDPAWHLRAINMPEAWEYTTGDNIRVMIGVSDNGFDTLNDDLEDKFTALITSEQANHGMATSGAMAAIGNNGIKMTGINWQSTLVAGYMGIDNISNIINIKDGIKDVKVINNSWGYVIPSTFDPTDSTVASDRFAAVQNVYASTRQLIKDKQNDVLFVWMAGNGVNNGLSDSGYYGVDAKYDNGALHYENDLLNKLDNLMVVAAFDVDDKDTISNPRLEFYSNFGESVDIAAPTNYDSLALDNGITQTFTGTSASAPLVTAVASLMFSINPEVSATAIKQIMIQTATQFITQRKLSPRADDKGVTTLDRPIPILNAKAAIEEMVRQFAEKTVSKTIEYTDITIPRIKITYTPNDTRYSTVKINNYDNYSSNDPLYNFDMTLDGTLVSGDTIEFDVDTNKKYQRLETDVVLKFDATNVEFYSPRDTYYYSFSDINISTKGTVNLNPIANVDINITNLSNNRTYSISSDANGLEIIYLVKGDYRIVASKTGYNNYVSDLTITDNNLSLDINIPMSLDGTHIGTIDGYVRDNNDNIISNAVVSISGGTQTNGVFATTTTDENGYYNISNINLYDTTDTLISNFVMTATKDNFSASTKSNVVVLEGNSRVENFVLYPYDESIFVNNLENNLSAWTIDTNVIDSNITWQMYDFNNTILQNDSAKKLRIEIPVDDDSNGSMNVLFNQLTSWDKKAFWFGNINTGDYTDKISDATVTTSGGASSQIAEGNLTSPSFTLPSDSNGTSLVFDTLWEVEGQDPAQTLNNDQMEIYIIVDGTEVLVNKLNPIVNPSDVGLDYSVRLTKSYSSAGYMRKPIWVKEIIDLTAYNGKAIKIKFRFNSNDNIANGFRGWFIDNIRLVRN